MRHFRNMLIWRKEAGVDRIRNRLVTQNLAPHQFPHYSSVQQLLPSIFHKFDKVIFLVCRVVFFVYFIPCIVDVKVVLIW